MSEHFGFSGKHILMTALDLDTRDIDDFMKRILQALSLCQIYIRFVFERSRFAFKSIQRAIYELHIEGWDIYSIP